MKKQKSPIEPLKKLLQNAQLFKSDSKVFYAITKYAVEKISLEMKKNPNLILSENDKKEFEGVVKDMITQKKSCGGMINSYILLNLFRWKQFLLHK